MDLSKLLTQVTEKGPDQTVAQRGGGDYTPPAAGLTPARLVGYYEVGQHAGEYQGKPKTNNEVQLVFELLGSKHPPREVNGEKIPVRLTATMNLSTNEKAGFYKMFSRLRTEEKHFAQLLGKPVLLTVAHREVGEGANKRTYANIDRDSVKKPFIQSLDGEGNVVEQEMQVPPALTPLGAFIWDFATPEMWDSIYIPGEYEARTDDKGNVTAPARSKNVLQEKIASALNFKGLPCYDYAAGKLSREDAEALDEAVGDVEHAVAGDPLPGIG